jgi:hypothetical protein
MAMMPDSRLAALDGETVRFGSLTLRRRGSVLFVDHATGAMACLGCGRVWRAAMHDGGFDEGTAAICPRCGARSRS